MVHRTPAAFPQHAAGMGIVYIGHAFVFLRQLHNIRQLCDVPVHAEHAVGYYEAVPVLVAVLLRTFSRSSMSECLNRTVLAFERRQPSIMLAWFSSSEIIRSPSSITAGMVPELQVSPDWNTMTASSL